MTTNNSPSSKSNIPNKPQLTKSNFIQISTQIINTCVNENAKSIIQDLYNSSVILTKSQFSKNFQFKRENTSFDRELTFFKKEIDFIIKSLIDDVAKIQKQKRDRNMQ